MNTHLALQLCIASPPAVAQSQPLIAAHEDQPGGALIAQALTRDESVWRLGLDLLARVTQCNRQWMFVDLNNAESSDCEAWELGRVDTVDGVEFRFVGILAESVSTVLESQA